MDSYYSHAYAAGMRPFAPVHRRPVHSVECRLCHAEVESFLYRTRPSSGWHFLCMRMRLSKPEIASGDASKAFQIFQIVRANLIFRNTSHENKKFEFFSISTGWEWLEITLSRIPGGFLESCFSFSHTALTLPGTHLLIVIRQSIEFVPIRLWRSIGTCHDRLFEFS